MVKSRFVVYYNMIVQAKEHAVLAISQALVVGLRFWPLP